MKAALPIVFLIAGCAAPAPPAPWTRQGATHADLATDRAACEFDVAKATQTTDPNMRSIIGQELDRAVRQRDLMVLCLRAKGWQR